MSLMSPLKIEKKKHHQKLSLEVPYVDTNPVPDRKATKIRFCLCTHASVYIIYIYINVFVCMCACLLLALHLYPSTYQYVYIFGCAS